MQTKITDKTLIHFHLQKPKLKILNGNFCQPTPKFSRSVILFVLYEKLLNFSVNNKNSPLILMENKFSQ